MFLSGSWCFLKRLTVALLFLLSVLLVLGCSARDPSTLALEIADEWATENIDKISKDLTASIVNDNPLLKTVAAAAVEKEISKRVSWEYSRPVEVGPDLYEVVATAYSDIELPVMGLYRISLCYYLTIDIEQRRVLDASADMQSFTFRKV